MLSEEGYVAAGGVCPLCGGAEVEHAAMDTRGTRTHLQRGAWCAACGATWDAVYALVGYADLRPAPTAETRTRDLDPDGRDEEDPHA